MPFPILGKTIVFLLIAGALGCGDATPLAPSSGITASADRPRDAAPPAAEVKPDGERGIDLRGGTFVFEDGFGRLDVFGSRGFRLQATALSTGRFEPLTECTNPVCEPGATLAFDGYWAGSDLVGVAKLQGRTYDDLGALAADASAEVHFTGSLTLPPFTGESTSVTVPFALDGHFFYDLTSPAPRQLPLTAAGRATFFLVPHSLAEAWMIERAVFDFGSFSRFRSEAHGAR